MHGGGDGGAVGLGAVEGGVNGDERQPENGIWRFQAAFYAGAPDGFRLQSQPKLLRAVETEALERLNEQLVYGG